MSERLQVLADRCQLVCVRSGQWAAWLALLMVVATFVVVVLRYFFSLGYIWLQELAVYLHALVFLLGAAYTLSRDEHVRVDIFYRRMTPLWRRRVDMFGTVMFLLPTVAVIGWTSWDYVLRAWIEHESSPQTGGLPYPFVPLLKTAILAGMLLLAIQALAWLLRGGRIAASHDSRETGQD